MKVAVLMGGKSFEREVSLASGKVVCEALEEAGHKVVPLDTNADLVPTLRSERPDVVYNALHGKHGEDGTIQGLFEMAGVRYVGCGVTEKPLADIVMPPVFALESEPIRQLLKKLQQAKTHVAVVLDECGRFAVPVLSGHLGGANELARRLAAVCGAVPVITTATDANGVFAVDEWARHQNCAVLEPERIKKISGALLAGRTVRFASDWPIAGAPPDGITAGDAPDFALTLCPAGDALHLVPRIGVLGVGCKRGTSAETLAEAFAAFCAQNRLAPQCITAAASIDLKQNETGLLTFCKSHSWPVQFFTAEQLRAAPGSFTPSAFVQSVTGVDNVCERSAVLAAGGTLVFHKYAHTGVTFALAVRPYAPDWRWQNV